MMSAYGRHFLWVALARPVGSENGQCIGGSLAVPWRAQPEGFSDGACARHSVIWRDLEYTVHVDQTAVLLPCSPSAPGPLCKRVT